MLVCAGPRGEVAAQGITVTPANPTISVGQTPQFTASGTVVPTAVAAGGLHTCMRLPDGTVQCWGRNNFGQLGNGDGSLTSSSVPVAVRGLTTATRVVTGDAHTCALLGDGTVQCWGVGDSGQRGDGTFNNISTVPGAVVGITGAVAVAARGYHSCALLGDGTVWCWGRNSDGQLGVTPSGSQCPTTPGFFCSSTPVRATGITSAAAVIAGGYHTCALFGDGTAQCWGRNDDGQLGDGTFTSSSTPLRVGGLTGAAAVSGGFYHTCALLGDSTVQCWGRNAEGQLGNGTTIGSRVPGRVAGLPSATAVSGGFQHTCALLSDGTVQCWGRNLEGQLGDGTTTSSSTAVRVGGITGAVAVSAGILHTCALLANGTVKCWGAVGPNNDFGQLGNGATTGSSTPVTVTGTGVAWTSSNGAVATIDAVGRATGLNPGTATMTATGGSGASASTTLTVTDRVALSVVPAGTGTGSVSSSPPGISCGTDCSEPYDRGTVVTLTAAPGSGSTFNGWSGCDTVSGATCTVTMTAAKSVSATFNPSSQLFTLTVNRAGTGSGTATSSDGLISCPSTCTATYDGGISVTLTASPASGSTFTAWSGCDTVSGATCTVTMTAAKSVTATFTAQRFTLTVTRAGTGSGTATSSPPGINCGATCSAAYDSGTVVTLAATPAAGSTFSSWSGCNTVSGTICTVTMTAAKSVTATFNVAVVSAPVLKWQYGGCLPGPYCQTGWYSSPAVADLDGDGQPDVIWGAYDVVTLRGDSGSLKWRAPSGNRVWPGIAVADLTGDGTLEVIVARDSDQLTVYNRFGNVVWTRNPFSGGELRTLAVTDLETGGQLEIIVGQAAGLTARQLNVLAPNGTVRPGWPARHDGEPGDSFGMWNQNVTVADMNGDGFKELFVPGGHYINAFDRNGNQLTVNPIFAPRQFWSEVGVHVDQAVDLRGYANCGVDHRPSFDYSAPVVADVDGDGVPELIVVGNIYNCGTAPYTSLYHMPFIFRLDRTRWSGSGFDWTVIPTPGPGSAPRSEDYNVIEMVFPNPAVADLDGDGFKEIIYPSYDGKVHAYWLDKTEHGSWPYTIPTTGAPGDDFRFASEPVVVDLDNDGHAEVIFTSWPKKATGGVGQLHILNYLGQELYRIDLPAPALEKAWNGALAAPTIAHIDGSADLQLVIGTVASGAVAYTLPNSAGARILWGTGRGSHQRAGTPGVP